MYIAGMWPFRSTKEGVGQRPTSEEKRLRDEVRTLAHRVDVLEDDNESFRDRLNRMRARITSVQRDAANDLVDDDDEDEDEVDALINQSRRNR